jgi:hypothetical protein
MLILGRWRFAAVIDVHPDHLDRQLKSIAKTDTGPLKRWPTVNPPAKNAIVLTWCIDANILFDAIPAIPFQHAQRRGCPWPLITINA